MGTALKRRVPDRVKPSSGHSDVQPWASECPDVKNYKWRSGTGCCSIAVSICQQWASKG